MKARADEAVLLLRLAGPLQSWGDRSVKNRRETRPEPTKSGILGLLAAAQGRARSEPVEDLLEMRLGIRVDQPGSLLRDYHTASDYRGKPLPQAGVSAKGVQKPTSPVKNTYVTERFYLQDAVFLAAVAGPGRLVETLGEAVRRPAFPLALGRRSCVPTQPLFIEVHKGISIEDALRAAPWQASNHTLERYERRRDAAEHIDLPATIEDADGDDLVNDVPSSFEMRDRSFAARRIRHTWIRTATGYKPKTATDENAAHDPFALLGGAET